MRTAVGLALVILGVVLAVTHILTIVVPLFRATSDLEAADESGFLERLAEKAPTLAGGLAFAFLGVAVLGLVDLSIGAA